MDKTRIDNIFTNGRSLVIPFFQRSYVWKEDNWERFLQDMAYVSSAQKDYFLGTYIMKQQTTNSTDTIGDIRTVIDGQQRFTTILLFFYVLYKKNNKYDDFKQIFFNRNKEIILHHNHNDIEIFNLIMNDFRIDEKDDINKKEVERIKKEYRSNLVFKAYTYFQKEIADINDYNINTLLNKLYFVGIDIQANEDEQQIFDTINSLGVRLTTAELLKNELFDGNDLSLYERTWQDCFEKNNDVKEFWDAEVTSGRIKRTNIDLFLYSYLVINYEKEFTVEKLFNSFKEYLKEKDYKSNKEIILSNITSYAEKYYEHVKVNCCAEPLKDKTDFISRLNIVMFGLETTTLLPYFLYLLKEIQDVQNLNQIFSFLEKYIVRRFVSKEVNKGYNNLFSSLIRNDIKTEKSLKEYIYKKESTSKMPSDDDMINALNNSDHDNTIAKGILYLLEISMRTDNDNTTLLSLNKYDLEHIMPKKWNIHWKNFDFNNENAVNNREKHIKLLGNKTILTSKLNKSIKNADWKTKKEGNKKYGGYLQYAKGLKTFNFEQIDDWDENEIDKRTTELFEKIKQIWSYDNI